MRKILPLCVIALILFSLAAVPVKAQAPPTRVYADPAIYDGTAVPVGTVFDVTVYIENAVELVQWSLSVQVDPAVLEVMGARTPTGRNYILDNYAIWVNDIYFTAFSTTFMAGNMNKTLGTITDASQVILGWPDLNATGDPPVGGFDGSVDPQTGSKAKLCTIAFKTKSQTAYSLIDIFDVKLFDTATSPAPHWLTEPYIIVDDGYYNKPSVITINVWAVNRTFPVTFVSNSTIQDGVNVVFSLTDKSLSFNATGPSGTIGFCNVTIPKELLRVDGDVWIIKVNGTAISGWEASENATHSFLNLIVYDHNARVEIIGKFAYPEFPTNLIMPLVLVTTLFVALLGKVLWSEKRKGRVIATPNKAV